METATWMFDIVLRLQPKRKKPNFQKWANDIRLMRERDQRTDADIRALFHAADADPFWRKNIRSPDTLREKWDRLELEFKDSSPTKGNTSPTLEARWREVVSYCRNIDTRQPGYTEALRQKFGQKIAAAVKQIGVSKIQDASNDYDRRTQFKEFQRIMEGTECQTMH